MKTNSSQVRFRGVTLVELLVVVAAMAILAGLLLPTLNRAKAKGRAACCKNNLGQLHIAWRIYADENGGRVIGNVVGWITGLDGVASKNVGRLGFWAT
jgi:prepilin-type N-terminal cleavage/methylation domain-containing protein